MKCGLRLAGCCLQLPREGGTCVVVLPQWIFGAVVLLHLSENVYQNILKFSLMRQNHVSEE